MSQVSDVPALLTVLGCGDAFGTGGRLQTCFHVLADRHRFLIDCGASALIGMRRFGVDPGSIDTVLLTHFHADHMAGVPFVLLEARVAGRSAPLTIAGPPGVRARVDAAMRLLFPGTGTALPFDVRFLEYGTAQPLRVGPLEVSAFPVVHSPESLPHALRVAVAGTVVAYSGDTEWTPVLSEVSSGADLFICDCTGYETPVPVHLDYATLRLHRPALDCRRMLLTHMGPETLANAVAVAAGLDAIPAEDGLEVELTEQT